MRVTWSVLLLGALGMACNGAGSGDRPAATMAPAASASPEESASPGASTASDCTDSSMPPDAPVKVLLGYKQGGTECVVLSVSPARVPVCKYTKTITWSFENKCKAIKAWIGPRSQTSGTGMTDDPLTVSGALTPSPYPIPASASTVPGEAFVTAHVKALADAEDGCYKYDIEGEAKMDPEIEVRRGNVAREVRCK